MGAFKALVFGMPFNMGWGADRLKPWRLKVLRIRGIGCAVRDRVRPES